MHLVRLYLALFCAIIGLLAVPAMGRGDDGTEVQVSVWSDSTQAPVLLDESRARLGDLMVKMQREGLANAPFDELLVWTAERFRGAPYAAGMLDQLDQERLVIALTKFDCVTYVESVVAIARGIAVGDTTFQGFKERLTDLRYRRGRLIDYGSRLHYFSEWIADNSEMGYVASITDRLGGVPLEKEIDFMSTHRSSYPRLVDSEQNYKAIRAREDTLNRETIYYIPQDKIESVYDQLRSGDVLAMATSVEGLDVAHTGLVYRHADGGVGMIHASLDGGVVIEDDLASYVRAVSHHIGIMVARPRSPVSATSR